MKINIFIIWQTCVRINCPSNCGMQVQLWANSIMGIESEAIGNIFGNMLWTHWETCSELGGNILGTSKAKKKENQTKSPPFPSVTFS